MNKKIFLLVVTVMSVAVASATRPLRQYFAADGSIKNVTEMTTSEWVPCEHCLNQGTVGLRSFDTVSGDGLGVYGTSAKGTLPSIGSPQIPVIMVDFPDLPFMETTTIDKVSRMFNEEGYNDQECPELAVTKSSGSVRDYFVFNSGGMFTPQFDVVAKVTAANNHGYYGGNSSSTGGSDKNFFALLIECINLAKAQGVSLDKYKTAGSKVPLVIIVFAGPGEHASQGTGSTDYLWPKYTPSSPVSEVSSFYVGNEVMEQYSGNVPMRKFTTGIGVMIHELCHALGLPDVYDTQYQTPVRETPAFWSVMDYGQYQNMSYKPMQMSAYERCCLGWLDLKELPTVGSVSMDQMEAYLVRNPADNKQYYIMEPRFRNAWYSEGNFGQGMLLWQIKYNSSYWINNIPNNYLNEQCIHVVPADGVWQGPTINTTDDYDKYRGDLYPGNSLKPEQQTHSELNLYGHKVFCIHTQDGAVYMDHNPEGVEAVMQRQQSGLYYDLNPWIRISNNKKYLNHK